MPSSSELPAGGSSVLKNPVLFADLRMQVLSCSCLVQEGVDELLLGLWQEDLLVVGLGEELEELEDILEEWESK